MAILNVFKPNNITLISVIKLDENNWVKTELWTTTEIWETITSVIIHTHKKFFGGMVLRRINKWLAD